MKNYMIVGVILGIIGILIISGCVKKEEGKIEENYSKICENYIIKEYNWKIIELRAETLKAGMADEIIENETKKELENFTKDYLIKNAKEYDLDDEDIAYLKNLTDEEFEEWKKEYIAPKIIEDVKKAIEESLREIVSEYNYSIIEIKDVKEIKDIPTYLESYGISNETIEKVKNKFGKAKFIGIVELNIGEKLIVPEFCNEKGEIIKEEFGVCSINETESCK
ncbi:MAG: hypothetical protein ACK4YO_01660 [Candidatus Altarchaeaceae archaeon]